MHAMNDTIVALATPPGVGAIGIIRLSGAEAITIADAMFKGKKLANAPSHTLHFGKIISGSEVVDEVVASLYKNPKSYTGEDVVEISCHGSDYVIQKIISICIQYGARMAKPGEFTQRAFLNGKLDLTQAEAVADLISSQSQASHHSAMHNLRGGFSDELKHMRDELIKFSALIELELDFSEEDVEFADRAQLNSLLGQLAQSVDKLLQSFRLGNVVKNGVSVAIIGKPNAGKSTLLNALLNEERAIVSEIAGTTRDTIEESLNINGVLFRLIDTAGIREHTSDAIETIGVERSMQAMKKADIVLYLFDITDNTAEDISSQVETFKHEGIKHLLLANKIDKEGSANTKEELANRFSSTIFISAKHNEHIEAIKATLYELAVGGEINAEGTIVTNARHFASLQLVLEALQDIKNGMDQRISGDLLALDIRRCLYYIGDITGEVTTEDKLDYIFSKFCIGK
ncbi:MAG: tRNA uridine-5-carboxymethylaminomethyl(34) synthesis GTPase MnmE [Sphingobacteriales bacterium]|nr:MAG: tRNA uridine-5-carboxymethylaminomethyl(34) synthesis GTPase MnmE [Sphingobacteriales bacterium]